MQYEVRERGLKKLVIDCPNCVKMMGDIYGRLGIDIGAKLQHTSEFLRELLDSGALKVRSLGGTATYHDPCLLVYDVGVTSAPRTVLETLGCEIREPVYSKEHAHCCGGLPGSRLGDEALAHAVTAMRVNELRETDADIYVTACPSCRSVLAELGMKDIAELVAEHIVGWEEEARSHRTG
jgi:Fe-S oxidoreductase